MKALLIRVGIDTGYGGALMPLFDNNCFPKPYIPIPHDHENEGETEEDKTYSDYDWDMHLPNTLKRPRWNKPVRTDLCFPHFDPEFKTLTYGDHTQTGRGGAINKLERGDYLIFFAGFKQEDKIKYGIIGYFLVEAIYTYKNIIASEDIRDLLKENAHIKMKNWKDRQTDLIVVKGDKDKSKLLHEAYIISKEGKNIVGNLMYKVSDEFATLSGLPSHQIARGVKWITSSKKVRDVISEISKRAEPKVNKNCEWCRFGGQDA